jgi:hypothetical protein
MLDDVISTHSPISIPMPAIGTETKDGLERQEAIPKHEKQLTPKRPLRALDFSTIQGNLACKVVGLVRSH